MAIIILTGWMSWGTFSRYTRGLPPKPVGQNKEFAQASQCGRMNGLPSYEQRKVIAEQMMNEIKLSDEQKRRVREIMARGEPKTDEERRARIKEMEKITTSEQQAQFRQLIMQRVQARMERARKTLSPQDFSTLQQRVAQRISRIEGNGGHPSPPPSPAR